MGYFGMLGKSGTVMKCFFTSFQEDRRHMNAIFIKLVVIGMLNRVVELFQNFIDIGGLEKHGYSRELFKVKLKFLCGVPITSFFSSE